MLTGTLLLLSSKLEQTLTYCLFIGVFKTAVRARHLTHRAVTFLSEPQIYGRVGGGANRVL